MGNRRCPERPGWHKEVISQKREQQGFATLPFYWWWLGKDFDQLYASLLEPSSEEAPPFSGFPGQPDPSTGDLPTGTLRPPDVVAPQPGESVSDEAIQWAVDLLNAGASRGSLVGKLTEAGWPRKTAVRCVDTAARQIGKGYGAG